MDQRFVVRATDQSAVFATSTSRISGNYQISSASMFPTGCPRSRLVNRGGARVSKTSIAAVLLALGVLSLQEGTNAMVAPPSGVQPASATPAIVETVALRKDGTVTRHVVVRHRGTKVRIRHVASGHRRVAVRTRHVAVRHRAVATRKTHVAVARRSAVAAKSAEIVRPVRPWVRQPYYGSVFDGVTLGAIVAATAVPTSPSLDLCWYWSNSSQTRGYWDFCQ